MGTQVALSEKGAAGNCAAGKIGDRLRYWTEAAVSRIAFKAASD